jgi:hypothetical protein
MKITPIISVEAQTSSNEYASTEEWLRLEKQRQKTQKGRGDPCFARFRTRLARPDFACIWYEHAITSSLKDAEDCLGCASLGKRCVSCTQPKDREGRWGYADRHKARSLPQPFFEGWDHRRPLAKHDTTRQTRQVGIALYADPRPPPAILNCSSFLPLKVSE